ncbi:MAG: bacillithiol system redox-active protein YtxJ [Flavobacteriales bacterium]|nr:bacillithiol system redox-active protein YtxJ [Flavobacteriales bacterium]
MFSFFGNETNPSSWHNLTQLSQLDEIIEKSYNETVVIFKHSTRCSISSMAKSRLEKHTDLSCPTIYYLDLIAHRDISNEIAARFGITHESPQVIVLKNGIPIYHASHGSINMDEIKKAA